MPSLTASMEVVSRSTSRHQEDASCRGEWSSNTFFACSAHLRVSNSLAGGCSSVVNTVIEKVSPSFTTRWATSVSGHTFWLCNTSHGGSCIFWHMSSRRTIAKTLARVIRLPRCKENMTPHLVAVVAGAISAVTGGFDAACNEMRRVELTITEVNNNEIWNHCHCHSHHLLPSKQILSAHFPCRACAAKAAASLLLLLRTYKESGAKIISMSGMPLRRMIDMRAPANQVSAKSRIPGLFLLAQAGCDKTQLNFQCYLDQSKITLQGDLAKSWPAPLSPRDGLTLPQKHQRRQWQTWMIHHLWWIRVLAS